MKIFFFIVIAGALGVPTSGGAEPLTAPPARAFGPPVSTTMSATELRAARSITPRFSSMLLENGDGHGIGSATADVDSPSDIHYRIGDWHLLLGETANPDVAAYRSRGDGRRLFAGLGYRFSERFVLGAALDADESLRDGAGSFYQRRGDHRDDRDAFGLSLFSRYDRQRFFVDGHLNWLSDLPLSGDTFGDDAQTRFALGLGVGYRFADGPMTLTPRFELDYLNGFRYDDDVVGRDDSIRLGSLSSSFGGQLSYRLDSDWGRLIPHVDFQWVHEFEQDVRRRDDRRQTEGAVRSLQTLPERDYFNLGLGVSAQFNDGGAAFLSYEKVFGKRDVTSDFTVTGGVRFEF